MEPTEISLTLPIAEPTEGVYEPRHINLQLDRRQRAALRKLLEGCDRAGCRLKNQRRVVSAADTIRYLLERASDSFTTSYLRSNAR